MGKKQRRTKLRKKRRRSLVRELIKGYRQVQPVRLVVLLVTTLALITVSIFLFISRPSAVETLGDSYLETVTDVDTMKKNIETDYTSIYPVKNYSIYGESLKFYHGTSMTKMDALQGINITLRNLETKDEMNFTYGSGAEDGIKLGAIKPGLYEVYVYDKYIKKRVYFHSKVESEVFEGLRRNKRVKHIQLIADKDILKDYDVVLDKNYAFLSVTDAVPKVDTIDIMIDPCGPTHSDQKTTKEQKDAYAFARHVKTELESYGLKVRLTRDEKEKNGYYGKDGRVGKGYEQKAKVFLSLGYINDYTDADRPIIMTSPYTSAALANSISYTFQNDGLHMYETNADDDTLLDQGIVYDTFIDKDILMGTKTHYESYPQLRESGGKCTLAGQYSESTDNQRYSQAYGMYGLYFQFENPSSNDSMTYFKKYQKKMAKGLAKGIVRYFTVEENA